MLRLVQFKCVLLLLLMVVSSSLVGLGQNLQHPNRTSTRRGLMYDRDNDIRHNIERYPADRDPRPFSKNNRLLGMLLMFDFHHIDSFMLLVLPEYVSMCEGGWDPDLVIFTTVEWSPMTRRLMREKAYCYRTNKDVNIKWATYNPSISIALAAQHRIYMTKHVEDYDVFMYHEDDIPFKFHHVQAFTQETALLKERFPWTGLYE
jgi:hypothetical protein